MPKLLFHPPFKFLDLIQLIAKRINLVTELEVISAATFLDLALRIDYHIDICLNCREKIFEIAIQYVNKENKLTCDIKAMSK